MTEILIAVLTFAIVSTISVLLQNLKAVRISVDFANRNSIVSVRRNKAKN